MSGGVRSFHPFQRPSKYLSLEEATHTISAGVLVLGCFLPSLSRTKTPAETLPKASRWHSFIQTNTPLKCKSQLVPLTLGQETDLEGGGRSFKVNWRGHQPKSKRTVELAKCSWSLQKPARSFFLELAFKNKGKRALLQCMPIFAVFQRGQLRNRLECFI